MPTKQFQVGDMVCGLQKKRSSRCFHPDYVCTVKEINGDSIVVERFHDKSLGTFAAKDLMLFDDYRYCKKKRK